MTLGKIYLRALKSPKVPKQAHRIKHASVPLAIAFSNHAEEFATACEDGVVELWSEGGARRLSRYHHRSAVTAMNFSPDDTLLATGSDDKTARIWDLRGDAYRPALAHGGWVQTVAFSPDGRLLLTGSQDRTARLWDVATGEPRGKLQYSAPITAVAWTPDGDYVATGATDTTVNFWKLKDDAKGTKEKSFNEIFILKFGAEVIAISFAPCAERLLIATENWIYCYRWQSRQQTPPVLIASRLAIGRWSGAFRWTEAEDSIELGLLDTSDTLVRTRVGLQNIEFPPIVEKPEELLAEWQIRLGLQIDTQCRISPAFL